MRKANQGLVLIVTLLFIFLTSFQVMGLSEQLMQGNKLVFALQHRAEQHSRYKSFEASLASILPRFTSKSQLLELTSQRAAEQSEQVSFAQLITCPSSLDVTWSRLDLPIVSENAISYIRVLPASLHTMTDSLVFVVVSCVRTKNEVSDFITANVYNMNEDAEVTRRYHAVSFAQGGSL